MCASPTHGFKISQHQIMTMNKLKTTQNVRIIKASGEGFERARVTQKVAEIAVWHKFEHHIEVLTVRERIDNAVNE